MGIRIRWERLSADKNIHCSLSAPDQKAEIAVGHEFIRRILLKGKRFDELA